MISLFATISIHDIQYIFCAYDIRQISWRKTKKSYRVYIIKIQTYFHVINISHLENQLLVQTLNLLHIKQNKSKRYEIFFLQNTIAVLRTIV